MKFFRLFALTLTLASLAVFSGCRSHEQDPTGLYAKNNRGVNLLGIVDSSPASYQKVPSTTLDVHTDQLYKRKNISGDNVSFLWGAITVADY